MNPAWLRTICLLGAFSGGTLFATPSWPASAQVQTQKSVVEEGPTKEVTVERGEIVAIQGNNVVIKMADGTLRDFHNVPESVTFMVEGKPVNIKNAKVGMKLEKQTIRTTTPRVIRTVETVSGKVWQIQPPNWVILTLDNGTNQRFNIPKGQKFLDKISGTEIDAFGLRKGMIIDAQRVAEVAETVVEDEVKRTGKMPPPPTAEVKPDLPILIVMSSPPTAPPVETSAAEKAPTALPKTASNLPLVGLLGALLSVFSVLSSAARTAHFLFRESKQ